MVSAMPRKTRPPATTAQITIYAHQVLPGMEKHWNNFFFNIRMCWQLQLRSWLSVPRPPMSSCGDLHRRCVLQPGSFQHLWHRKLPIHHLLLLWGRGMQARCSFIIQQAKKNNPSFQDVSQMPTAPMGTRARMIIFASTLPERFSSSRSLSEQRLVAPTAPMRV